MAANPYGQGAPEVTADNRAPDDYQHIQANPDAFGAGIAQAAGNAAQGALDIQKFYGQVAADDATNKLQEFTNTTLNGDPTQHTVGPDGTTLQVDTGFLGKRGADAMSAAPDVLKALEEHTAEIRGNLPSAEARLQFDQDSRRYRFQWESQVTSHARGQQEIWAKSVNSATATTQLNTIGSDPENNDTFGQATASLREAYKKQAQLDGTDPSEAIMRADQTATITRIKALEPTNPALAEKVLNANTKILAGLPNYDGIYASVKSHVIESQIGPASDAAIARAKGEALSSVGVPGQESPEGVTPPAGSRAATNLANNNPGNLKVPGSATQFQSFPTKQAGIDAVGHQIGLYVQRGQNTVSQIVSTYAPPTDNNNTTAYTAFVAKKAGIDPNTPITAADIPKVRDAMIQFEQGGGSSGGQKYPTATDALRGNYEKTISDAQDYAQKTWPQYQDAQDRYVSRVERGLNMAITQQNQQYEIAAHTVQAAMTGAYTQGHPPTNERELRSISPEIASAFDSMRINDPLKAASVERIFDANSAGKTIGYGDKFNDLFLDGVLAPAGAQGRVQTAADLWPYVQPGEKAPLTNTGLSTLSDIVGTRGTPQGDARAAQLRTFYQGARKLLSQQDPTVGVFDPKGEKRFQQFVAASLPVISAEEKSGKPLSSLLLPKGDIHNMIFSYDRPLTEKMKDRITDSTNINPNGLTGDVGAQQAQLRTAYQNAKTDGERRALINQAIQKGWWTPPKTAAPTHVPAGPPPVPGAHDDESP